MKQLSKVSSKYGAPMGRHTGPTISYGGKIRLNRIRINSGGYDSGGAYWGIGQPLWHYENEDGEEGFLRARDREAAKQAIRALLDGAPEGVSFYR